MEQHVFFTPHDGLSGDYIPFYWDGTFRLFYLLDKYGSRSHLDGISWNLVETKDFMNFEPQGVMLPFGTEDQQDRCVYTGSVLCAQGKFHIFYTGHNPLLRKKGLPEQKVMHAVSNDLHHWQKLPEHTFQSAVGFEIHDWRDPFVFFDDADGLYHMLLAARVTGGVYPRRGCTAHLTSADLVQWKNMGPLWMPESYFTHECPDLFKIGDWYYMIFSEFSDIHRTRYVMSKSLYGPWIAPQQDVFDTRAYYAAKSCTDGKKRYLFGWVASRSDNTDFSPFRWAGSLVVHELYALENGELACREPESISKAWKVNEQPLVFEDSQTVGFAQFSNPYGTAVGYAVNEIPDCFRFEADMTIEPGTHDVGVLLRADAETDVAYALKFEPDAHRVDFFIKPKLNYRHFNDEGMNRVFHMPEGKPFHLSLTVDRSIAVAYIDHRIAFSLRIYSLSGKQLGFWALHGGLKVENAKFGVL